MVDTDDQIMMTVSDQMIQKMVMRTMKMVIEFQIQTIQMMTMMVFQMRKIQMMIMTE